MWDVSYSVSSIMLALLLGVVVGNVLLGVSIGENFEFEGSWLQFLNPYAIGVGLTTVALFTMHGAIYLAMKTEGKLYDKITGLLRRAIIAFVVLFAIVTLYTLIYIPHLSDDFKSNPALFVVPLLAFLSIANIPRLASKHKFKLAFLFSALSVSFVLMLVAIELYPVLIISTIGEQYDITVYNAASSEKSLGIMLLMAAIGAPLVLAYTVFVYKTFWGKVKLDETSY